MIKRWYVIVSILLFSIQTALACGGGPTADEICLPGLALMGLHVGLVLSILAGCIERPFLTWAGVPAFAREYSIQANFLGTVGMGVILPMFLDARWIEHHILWIWGSIALTAGLEWLWVAKPWKRGNRRVRFSLVLVGNLVSAVIIFFLPSLCHAVGTMSYPYRKVIFPIADGLALPIFLGCVIVFVTAFVRTRRDVTAIEDPRRGFEVIAVGSALPVVQ